MPALFTQARNGTVSIIKDLTQEQAEKALDIALCGPEKRKARERELKYHHDHYEMARVVDLYFSGNKNAKNMNCLYYIRKQYNTENQIYKGRNSSYTFPNQSSYFQKEITDRSIIRYDEYGIKYFKRFMEPRLSEYYSHYSNNPYDIIKAEII